MEKDGAEPADRGRFLDEVQWHVGVRLLGERHPREVDVEHLAAHRIATHVVHERRDLTTIEAGQREERRVAPAPVGKLEGVHVRLDGGRWPRATEDDARQHTLPTKGAHLLSQYHARTDRELLGFSHDESLS